jgi:hypothetical protein
VAFDGPLKNPLRFREAISALHDVVISDLRHKPRDKTAYATWKKEEARRLQTIRAQAYRHAREEILARRGDVPLDLEESFNRCRKKYWNARQSYSNYLLKNDRDLWRMLMPCDPVITVADDVMFFECFSADESSYGCLTVNREDGFGSSDSTQFGTTNVDYSWRLYEHFQSLRTYRETRFRIDPAGFEVAMRDVATYREEKIDLPPGWLRGFMQLQSAMTLPMRRVSLSREAVYSLLVFLRRNKARKSPRAIRFELLPHKPPAMVLEPWEERIISHGTKYDGPPIEPIRIWGRQRLLVLARLLPFVERLDVYLLGTGLPSFWVAQMGDMRLTLGLSGWTTNDWTHGSALDTLAPPLTPSLDQMAAAARFLREQRHASLDAIRQHMGVDVAAGAATLNRLAHTGQLIYDLDARQYRWRQVMPQALGEAELGPENVELAASRELAARDRVAIESRQILDRGGQLLVGKCDGKPVELMIDVDGLIKRGKCVCSHHYKVGLRGGPCRHLQAMRTVALKQITASDPNLQSWFDRLQRWASN